MVEKEGFGAFKNNNITVLTVQYMQDVYRNIDKINTVTSLNNTSFPYLL